MRLLVEVLVLVLPLVAATAADDDDNEEEEEEEEDGGMDSWLLHFEQAYSVKTTSSASG